MSSVELQEEDLVKQAPVPSVPVTGSGQMNQNQGFSINQIIRNNPRVAVWVKPNKWTPWHVAQLNVVFTESGQVRVRPQLDIRKYLEKWIEHKAKTGNLGKKNYLLVERAQRLLKMKTMSTPYLLLNPVAKLLEASDFLGYRLDKPNSGKIPFLVKQKCRDLIEVKAFFFDRLVDSAMPFLAWYDAAELDNQRTASMLNFRPDSRYFKRAQKEYKKIVPRGHEKQDPYILGVIISIVKMQRQAATSIERAGYGFTQFAKSRIGKVGVLVTDSRNPDHMMIYRGTVSESFLKKFDDLNHVSDDLIEIQQFDLLTGGPERRIDLEIREALGAPMPKDVIGG